MTRGGVGPWTQSDGGRWTKVRPIWCSLDLSGPCRTLPVWSPTVRPRRRSDDSINAWQWTVGGNGRFDLNEVTWQHVVGCDWRRTPVFDGATPHICGFDGHLSGLTVTSSWGVYLSERASLGRSLSNLTYFSSLRAELVLSIHSYLIDSSVSEIG